MSAHRLVVSAEARDERPPKRNLAAGKRLAPLPPGLRSRVRNAPADAPLVRASTTATFAHTAPASHATSSLSSSPLHQSPPSPHAQPQQRSSSRARLVNEPASNEAANRGGLRKDGRRRYLPPVPPGEAQARSRVHHHSNGSGVSSSAGGSALSTSATSAATVPTAPDGRRSAPADNPRSRRASNVSVKSNNKNSNSTDRVTYNNVSAAGGGLSSATAAGGSVSASAGGATRASTSEGTRRPSPSTASKDVSSARGGRPGLRAPLVASRASARPANSQASNTASIAAILRNPVSSARRSGAAGGSVTPTATPVRTFTSTPSRTLQQGSSAEVQEHPQHAVDTVTATAVASPTPVVEPKVHITVPEYPLAPHDLDETFYTNRNEWATTEDVPPLVWSLLEGTSLEAPYTTYLWTQAYPRPVELLPAAPLPGSNGGAAINVGAASGPFSASRKFTQESSTSDMKHYKNNNNDAQSEDPLPETLPLALQHRVNEKRRGGFYACVRCATPICSPDYQVVPAAAALRGIAVFSRLHLKGVDLRVRTRLEAKTTNHSYSNSTTRQQQRPSFAGAAAGGGGGGGLYGKSLSAADALLQQTSGGVQFLAHCHHCGACLGAMFIGEVARPTTPAHNLSATSSAWGGGVGTQGPSHLAAHELLCVNSACLQYCKHRTQAALDGELLGKSSQHRRDESFRRNSAEAGRATTSGVTMGALFGAPPQTAWDLQGDLTRSGLDREKDADTEEEEGDDAFDDLLDALNPYSGGGGGGDSDSD